MRRVSALQELEIQLIGQLLLARRREALYLACVAAQDLGGPGSPYIVSRLRSLEESGKYAGISQSPQRIRGLLRADVGDQRLARPVAEPGHLFPIADGNVISETLPLVS